MLLRKCFIFGNVFLICMLLQKVSLAENRIFVFSTNKVRKCYYCKFEIFGDVTDVVVSVSSNVLTDKGSPTLEINYEPKKKELKWVCLYFTPEQKVSYTLTGVEKIIFVAKGTTGNEIISSVGIGGLKEPPPDTDIFQTGAIKLSKEWKKYSFDVRDRDLSSLRGGFFIVLELKDNPRGAKIYVDEIYYEGKKVKIR